MFLSVPSKLDALMPTSEQHESTQVEVSYAAPRKECSIQVLSNDTDIESDVTVPTKLKEPKHFLPRRAPFAKRTNKKVLNQRVPTTRPSSSICHGRSSLPHESSARRRETQSC